MDASESFKKDGYKEITLVVPCSGGSSQQNRQAVGEVLEWLSDWFRKRQEVYRVEVDQSDQTPFHPNTKVKVSCADETKEALRECFKVQGIPHVSHLIQFSNLVFSEEDTELAMRQLEETGEKFLADPSGDSIENQSWSDRVGSHGSGVNSRIIR